MPNGARGESTSEVVRLRSAEADPRRMAGIATAQNADR
jgi:hypothetical protein